MSRYSKKKVKKELNIDSETPIKLKLNDSEVRPNGYVDGDIEETKEDVKSKKLKKKKTSKKRKNKSAGRKKKRRLKKKAKLFLILIVLIAFVSFVVIGVIYSNHVKEKETKEYQDKLYKEILSHYNKYVVANKDADVYKLDGSKYTKIGSVGEKEELVLEEENITYKSEYLKLDMFDEEYYIYYKDIDILSELSTTDDRYKKYIVFNKNVVTKNETSFYNEDGGLVYTLPISINLPIIINKSDMYGVEFNNRLLYVKSDEVSSVEDNKNTDSTNTKGIAVLNYHFFYDASDSEDTAGCNQIICLSTSNLKKHLDYIKNNGFFTPTMKELEMYIDGYIQLPKSVVLTIDDGWRADIGSNIMAEYEMNGTVFLMSAGYDPGPYKNEYIEVHSHGHDLHNPGVCPGGQGGAIKCLEKSKLLEDLKTSQDKLYGTTVFCYPFYEYNNYSIEVLKEAGYTMAFGGYGEGGKYKVSPGSNKYKLPRYVIYSYTSVNNIASYLN